MLCLQICSGCSCLSYRCFHTSVHCHEQREVHKPQQIQEKMLGVEIPRLLPDKASGEEGEKVDPNDEGDPLPGTARHREFYPEGVAEVLQASGKLIVLDQLLQKLHSAGHPVLLFAQMTHTLDILQDFLELHKYTYERLDGSIRAEERFAAIRSFSQQLVKGTSKTEVGKSENVYRAVI